MSIMSSKLIRHEICKDDLKHLGANFIDIEGDIYQVSFNFELIQITYVYGIDDESNFFLERIQPYILFLGNYSSEEEIVKVIGSDVYQFKQKITSSDFLTFLDVNNHFSHIIKTIEKHYLNERLSESEMLFIIGKIEEIYNKIQVNFDQSNSNDYEERP